MNRKYNDFINEFHNTHFTLDWIEYSGKSGKVICSTLDSFVESLLMQKGASLNANLQKLWKTVDLETNDKNND